MINRISQGWAWGAAGFVGEAFTLQQLALLGAVHGREAVPPQWRSMVLSCRPLPPRAKRPRAMTYWPVDVLDLAERLLVRGARGLGRDRSTP